MRKVSRPYFKNRQLILGNRKQERGGFLPILASAFAPVAIDLVGKVFGRGKNRCVERKRLNAKLPKIKFTRSRRRHW